jgi:hypothetical protein
MNPKFDIKGLDTEVMTKELMRSGDFEIPLYHFPATMREGVVALLERRPIWQTTDAEVRSFIPSVVPDNIARGLVTEAVPLSPGQAGGRDMFGVEWEYIPEENGSMVRPGEPLFTDANEWCSKLRWPDVETWDWAGCAERNKDFLDKDTFNVCWFLTGWFERLISFMDFGNAAVAMIDEEQSGAVKDLFQQLSDLYIVILSRLIACFPQISCFLIHDDWGGQKDTFFSPAIVAELIVPAMKKVTDFLHAQGKFCQLHSCGQIIKQVPNMIAAGWDCWNGQKMNDTQRIYELYGDKIVVGVIPENIDSGLSDEELRASARAFADKFCNPGKPCLLNAKGIPISFREELYKASRIRFEKYYQQSGNHN